MNASLRFTCPKGLLALAIGALSTVSIQAAPTISYPQSDPSSSEQYLLELINAARANPPAEGNMLASVTDPEILRYYAHYAVDTNQLRSDFNGYAAKPPLAFNPMLMASSREHSLDQAQNGFQSHDGSDGSHFDQRITDEGYSWHALGENVFAYVENPFFGHVGLNADWGVPTLDHRANIMNTDPTFPTYREIGISCVPSSAPGFGPLVITQDFGCPADPNVAYVVGVIYNDANGNGQYDEGEGLGGVNVIPDTGDNYAITSASGGFVIPLPPGSGTMNITVSGGSLSGSQTKAVQFVAGTNVKVDFLASQSTGPSLPKIELSAAAPDAAASANQVGVVVVKRKGDTSTDLNVSLRVGGSAVGGIDYSSLPASVLIPAGQSSVSVTVNPLSSSFPGVKSVKVKAAPSASYTVNATTHAKVRIIGAN